MNFLLILSCLLFGAFSFGESAREYSCPAEEPEFMNTQAVNKLIDLLRKNALEKQKALNDTITKQKKEIEILKQKLLQLNEDDSTCSEKFTGLRKQCEEDEGILKKEIRNLKERIEDLLLTGPVKKGDSTDIWQAARDGDLPAVRFYLNQDPSNLNKHKEDENNITPLIIAAYSSQLNIVEYLVRKGAELERADSDKNTALIVAAGWGNLSIVEYLISTGADLDIQGRHKWTAMHYAVWANDLDKVKLLIKHGADKYLQDEDGHIPLDQAQLNGYNSIIDFLSA